jgi:hypothetical protein
MSMKNSNDTIGNRSRYLPVCSGASTTVPHYYKSTLLIPWHDRLKIFICHPHAPPLTCYLISWIWGFRCIHKKWIMALLSACLSTWNLAPTGPIFIKSYIWVFFKSVEKTQEGKNSSTVCGDLHNFIVFQLILCIRAVSDRRWRGNQNTRFMFNNFPLRNVLFMI